MNDELKHPFYKKLYGAINKDMTKCYDVYYRGNETEASYYFKPVFKDHVADIIQEIKESLAMNSGSYVVSLLDSLIL